MARRFFLSIDPVVLDGYTDRRGRHPRRGRPLALVRSLADFRRSLQALPPRELRMLFQSDVLGVDQDEIADINQVRQSNVSYRLQRARVRLRLHRRIQDIASETTIRNALLDAGMPMPRAGVVLAALKTFSQKLAAHGLDVKQSLVRHAVVAARKLAEAHHPPSPERERERQALLRLLDLVESSWNHLSEIESQGRYAWKTTPGAKPPVGGPKPRKYLLPPSPGTRRRRGPFGYSCVHRKTGTSAYSATLIHQGRKVKVGSWDDIHETAHAVNFAHRLINGPDQPDINTILPEHQPDPHVAAGIETKIRDLLARRKNPTGNPRV